MEGWSSETDWARDVLWRIVALLFALAGVADRAAGLPLPRRRDALHILMRAEAKAASLIFSTAAGAPDPDHMPDRPCDAIRLAARLRVLALLLGAMLAALAASYGGYSAHGAAGPQTGRLAPAAPAGAGHRVAPAAPDTS